MENALFFRTKANQEKDDLKHEYSYINTLEQEYKVEEMNQERATGRYVLPC